jgi:hypothetical protein
MKISKQQGIDMIVSLLNELDAMGLPVDECWDEFQALLDADKSLKAYYEGLKLICDVAKAA